MNIRQKSDIELLIQSCMLSPDFVSMGTEQDSEFSVVQDEVWMHHETDGLNERALLSENLKGKLGIIINSLCEAHTKRRKPLSKIIESAQSLPDFSTLYGGKGYEPDYGYVGGLRTMKKIQHSEFMHLKYESQNQYMHHPEWLNAAEHGLIIEAGSDRLANLFPSGNYVYHATHAGASHNILKDGYISTATEIMVKNGGKIMHSNGGDIAISWNFNNVTIMPGSLGHLCGFLSSPELVLTTGGQLIVPVEAGHNELQYIAGNALDVERFKHLKAQILVWDRVFKEVALLFAKAYGPGPHIIDALPSPSELPNSNLANCLLAMHKGKLTPENLQELYTFNDGKTVFSEQLLDIQQSPLAVLLQSVIDGGDAQECIGRKVHNISELSPAEIFTIIDRTLTDFTRDEIQQTSEEYTALVRRHVLKTNLPIESTIFVCSDRDFETVWKYVLAHSKWSPIGVLLFDHTQARLPNFVFEKGLGDHPAIRNRIETVIPKSSKSIDWQDLFDEQISPKKNAASHMVKASQTIPAKSIVLHDDKLVIQ